MKMPCGVTSALCIYSCLLVLATNLTKFAVSANSGGAGACLPGKASVFASHLMQPTIITGSLHDGGYAIGVDSKVVQHEDALTIRPQGLEFDIIVAGPTFKGILIRVNGTTADEVEPGSDGLSIPANCFGRVGAVTHSNAFPKDKAVATVSLDDPGVHTVDITLVVQNSGGVSEYYFSSFSVEVKEISLGDELCVEGYVMDRLCIDLGTLLDNPSVRTLEGPDEHSVHCLVDVEACFASGYEILIDPGPGETLYRRGWRVNDNGNIKLRDMARQIGICNTCDDGGLLEYGFRVSMNCTVIELATDDSPPVCFLTQAKASTIPGASFCPGGRQESLSSVPSVFPTLIPSAMPSIPFGDPTMFPSEIPSSRPSFSAEPSTTPPTIAPVWFPDKKQIPQSDSKDDDAKLFNDEERGNLQRNRRQLKGG